MGGYGDNPYGNPGQATSGTYSFNVTRDDIISSAYRKTGELARGQKLSSSQAIEGSAALNSLVKSWQAYGVNLWTVEWVTQSFSAPSQILGSDGNNYTCTRSHTSDSTNNPVTGSNWTTYWQKSGTSGVAWVTATAYTSAGDFVPAADTLAIEQAMFRIGNVDYEVKVITRETYFSLSSKSITGTPNSIWFQAAIQPVAYLYPQIADTVGVLHYLRIRKLQDFNFTGDFPDFTSKYYMPLVYGLASILADEAGLPLSERQYFNQKAASLLGIAKGDDNERGDISFSPQMRG